MRHLGAMILVGAGVLLVAVGLLFLVAAGGHAHRYLVGAAAMGLGAVLAGLGARAFRRARALEPAALRAEVLALARGRDGRVSATDLAAALGPRLEAARPVIEALCRDGVCAREEADASTWYVFRDLLPRLAVRRCRFCEAELPLAEDTTRCPSCGGEVRVGVERVAMGDDDLYRMD